MFANFPKALPRPGVAEVCLLEWTPDSPTAQFLTDDERQRAGRFHFAEDRQRWAWWRSELRRILGEKVGVDPDSLRIGLGRYGKPYLQDFPELFFNLSHSRNWAALAVAVGGELGVDLEFIDPDFPALEIASNYFRPSECAALGVAEDPPALFFKFWTAKEALMKATGLGMNLEPSQIEVRLDGQGSPCGYAALGACDLENYLAHGFDAPPGAALCLAAGSGISRVEVIPPAR